MRYRNSEIKVDQLINYLNEEKINLSPAFQRGHVWTLRTRRKLIRNILLGRPIPAIFLYKEAMGSKYTYNILDGKQRLESLILFIADKREDARIKNWSGYFFATKHREASGFYVDLPEGKRTIDRLSDEMARDLREYSIPTIEITLDDETPLDEVITLFVDINQQGEQVKRFDIVKAMYKGDPLMRDVFSLVAVEQRRGQDVFYRQKANAFTDVLKRLQVVESVPIQNAKVDKMWEKLLEIAVFAQKEQHRNPVSILKDFITPNRERPPRLSKPQRTRLTRVFKFLSSQGAALKRTRVFTDQTHSYTVITSLLKDDLLGLLGEQAAASKLKAFAGLLDGHATGVSRSIANSLREYRAESARQTTHVSRRDARERLFVELVRSI